MARVFLGAVADIGPGTRARSSLSFFFVAQEGKGMAHYVAFAASGSGALRRRGRRLHTANMVSVCVFVTHIRKLWLGQLLRGARQNRENR
jgi:hypothetical protein